MRRTLVPALVVAMTLVLTLFAVVPSAAQEEPPVLVYVTWDGTPGQLVDRLLAEERMPNLQRLVDAGTYIPRTIGNFPSITPAGHAAVWTGAYSSVNGISTRIPDVLTDEEREAQGTDTPYGPVTAFGPSDFSAENLLVEPIWVTAARAGRTTTAVSVTHASPFEMYTTEDYVSSQGAHSFGDFSDELLLSDPYRTPQLRADTFLVGDEQADVPLKGTDAAGWRDVPAWPDAQFRSFTLGGTPEEGDDEILLHGLAVAPDGSTFTHAVLSPDRDYDDGETVRDTPAANDASQLSGPVRYTDCAGEDCLTGYAHFRLTDLADDGTSLDLWRSRMRDLSDYTTEPSRIDEWIATGGAFTGNAIDLPPIDELSPLPNVYGEIAFQVNEYFFDNLVHEIGRESADVYFSYSPFPDEWMHQLYGHMVAEGPDSTPERAALATSYIDAMMTDLDDHLGEVIDALEAGERDWNIVLTTDHGFEPEYYRFFPARALRAAGLLVTDEEGEVDPTRTKVFYAGNGVLRVNLEGVYAGGIVPREEYAEVVQATRSALLDIRGAEGEPIVRRVLQSSRYRHEGLGGRHGGELHMSLFPGSGYYWAADLGPENTPLVEDSDGGGWHGNRVVGNPQMQGFAVLGGDQFVDGHTLGRARSIDLTPTAAAAVGIPPADHWRGRVLNSAIPPDVVIRPRSR